MPRARFAVSCITLVLLAFVAAPAHAYIDPGTGSAILQGILAALAAIALTAKLYWHRLLRLLGLRKPTEATTDSPAHEQRRQSESADRD